MQDNNDQNQNSSGEQYNIMHSMASTYFLEKPIQLTLPCMSFRFSAEILAEIGFTKQN